MLALAAVVVLAVGAYLFFRLDDETRRLSEMVLKRMADPLEASIGDARYYSGRGVRMYEVELNESRAGRAPERLLGVEELRVEGRFDIASLVGGKPRVDRVVLKGARLRAIRRPDGTWNLAALRPPPPSGGPPPVIELQDATLWLQDQATAGSTPLVLEHVDATITPTAGRSFAIKASAEQSLAQKILVEGDIASDGGRCDLRVVVDGAPLSPALQKTVLGLSGVKTPPPVTIVSGRLGVEAAVRRSSRTAAPEWSVAFDLKDLEARTPLLRRPVRGIELVGEATQSDLRIDRLTAQWGDATLRAAGRRSGWGLHAPSAVRARVEGYEVSGLPTALLPGHAQRLLNRFKPAGAAKISLTARYDGARWSPRATVTFQDASFTDTEKFACRLTGAVGRIDLNGGAEAQDSAEPAAEEGSSVDVDLTARLEGAPVRVAARLVELESMKNLPPDQPVRPKIPPGWIEVTGNGVPITPRVIAALTDEQARRIVESLRPSGRVDVRYRADRADVSDPRHSTALDLHLVDCRVNYERFPYPLSGVTGWVRQRDRQWVFSELRSVDARGRTIVTGSGSLEPLGQGHALRLRFDSDATPLDQTLYTALPANTQQAWEFLRPRGQVGFTAWVTRPPGADQPDVRLEMRPQGRVSVEPIFSETGYRYRLEGLDGRFEWEHETLAMRGARARHGRTSFATDGQWRTEASGGWRLNLQGLHADLLVFNQEFLAASPVGLRSVVQSLQPQGVFDLFDSRLEVQHPGGPASNATARWDLSLNCHQATLQCGVPLEGVSGVVRLAGSAGSDSTHTEGELDLDSLFWNDIQLTEVRGPLWANSTECLLGEGVALKIGGEPRRVTARAYGGAVDLNSRTLYGGRPRYGLDIGLKQVDVSRLSSEWLARPEALQGTLEGRMQFEGAGATIYGLNGKGDLRVVDADLYELPLLLSMLKYLRNRTPDNTAFNLLEAKFAVQGEEIQFENLNLEGDAVSLYGRGTANLDREVNLVFHSLVGRNEFAVPVLRSLVGQASEQLLRLRVLGSLDAPEIRREALPLVGNMLEQFQGDPSSPSANRPVGAPTRR